MSTPTVAWCSSKRGSWTKDRLQNQGQQNRLALVYPPCQRAGLSIAYLTRAAPKRSRMNLVKSFDGISFHAGLSLAYLVLYLQSVPDHSEFLPTIQVEDGNENTDIPLQDAEFAVGFFSSLNPLIIRGQPVLPWPCPCIGRIMAKLTFLSH